MSRLTETRDDLYNALVAAESPWRVGKFPPPSVVAPCAWIDVPRVALNVQGRGAKFVVSQWSVYVVVDGSDEAQVNALDEFAARVWDTLDALPRVDALTVDPQAVDVGGPMLRGLVVTVEVMHVAKTLCLPRFATAATAAVT